MKKLKEFVHNESNSRLLQFIYNEIVIVCMIIITIIVVGGTWVQAVSIIGGFWLVSFIIFWIICCREKRRS